MCLNRHLIVISCICCAFTSLIFSSPEQKACVANYRELRRILRYSSEEVVSLAYERQLISGRDKRNISAISDPDARTNDLFDMLMRGGKHAFPFLLEMMVQLGEHDMHERLRLAIPSPGNGKCYVTLNISIHIHTSPVSISSILYMIAV